jgi:hypothetical protein
MYPVRFAAQTIRKAKQDLSAWEAVYRDNPSEDAVREILAARLRLEAARLALRKLKGAAVPKFQT